MEQTRYIQALKQPLIKSNFAEHIPNTLLEMYRTFFEVKTSLGALSKSFMGIELDGRVTLGSITLVRLKSAVVTAIWIGDRYMRVMKLFCL